MSKIQRYWTKDIGFTIEHKIFIFVKLEPVNLLLSWADNLINCLIIWDILEYSSFLCDCINQNYSLIFLKTKLISEKCRQLHLAKSGVFTKEKKKTLFRHSTDVCVQAETVCFMWTAFVMLCNKPGRLNKNTSVRIVFSGRSSLHFIPQFLTHTYASWFSKVFNLGAHQVC